MAKNSPVWAIDIGSTSLKALQCRVGAEPGTIEALAFDYVEHTKILSQPGAEPSELIAESIGTFLSRNNIKKDRVAISVSGQNTISRFLKLPPVDKKKLPDIIRFEAKQWLPFALEDVVWDYQPLTGGNVQGNTLVDSEIGMFAMKREFASRALAPFDRAGIPIDCIQSSPIAIYNFAAFDQINLSEVRENYSPQNPGEYVIMLCLGTDSSDVVITNGIKIWVRNITIGGNNFTKALTKGMKLTFTNAEHLKRNAAASQDPKAVFQVMRPVFNELLTEVNRSIEFYSSLDRKARFSKIIALGNPTKLPGLREFLRQNLGHDVVRLTKFNRLTGAEVLGTPAFADNLSSFGICYGLALQLLKQSVISTNLVPTEVVGKRILNNKKPWLLTGAAALMLGLVAQYTGVTTAYAPLEASAMKVAENQAKGVVSKSTKFKGDTQSAKSSFESIDKIGSVLTGSVEGRIVWPELYHVLNLALPQNAPGAIEGKLDQQDRVYVTSIDVQKVEDLAEWWTAIKGMPVGTYVPDDTELAKAKSGEGGGATADSSGSTDTSSTDTSSTESSSSTATSDGAEGVKGVGDKKNLELDLLKGPEGSGYIVQLSIYHYHNPDGATADDIGAQYVRRTFFHNLKYNTVQIPSTLTKQSPRQDDPVVMETVTMEEFGFGYPALLDFTRPEKTTIVDPAALQKAINKEILRRKTLIIKNQAMGGMGSRAGMGGGMGGGMGMSSGGGMGMESYGSSSLDATMSSGGSAAGMGNYSTRANPIIALAMQGGFGAGSGGGGGMGGGGMGAPSGGMSGGGMGSGAASVINLIDQLPEDQRLKVGRFDAVVQFVWKQKTPAERTEAREKLLAEEAAKAQTESTSPETEPTETAETASPEAVPTETVPAEGGTSIDAGVGEAGAGEVGSDVTADPADTTNTGTPEAAVPEAAATPETGQPATP